jgi:hypothetical protein
VISSISDLPHHSVSVVRVTRKPELHVEQKATTARLNLAVQGFLLALILLAFSIWSGDPQSAIATVCFSLFSSLAGYSNKQIDQHAATRQFREKSSSTSETVVISYPTGSFLVVYCDDEVARDLYFPQHTVAYALSLNVYRLFTFVNRVVLWVGIFSLANAHIDSQVAWAFSYALLGSMYWAADTLQGAGYGHEAAGYQVSDERLPDADTMDDGRFPEDSAFYQALCKAVVATKEVGWVVKSGLVPETAVWKEWVEKAERRV